ncbi:MAG: DUF3137 domain-containing protein [Bacteroidetes bacterium]|nr:DUF3137 domain-containing protein [Bacteroidota bacterium]
MNPENFRLFYNQTIHPELLRLDKHRRRLLRLIFFSAVLMVGAVALVYWLSVFFVAMLAAIPFGIHISVVVARVRRFVADFKPKVVKLVLDFIDDGPLFGDLQYQAKRKIPLGKFLSSQLFITRPAVYDGEDFIEGRIGDVEFEMCELNVKEFSRVRNRLDSVFRGIFLRAKFFHPPKGSLLVVPKSRLPYLSETVKVFVKYGGQDMGGFIKNEKFRERFIAYGSRNTKINELLTEELMSFLLGYSKERGDMCLSMFGQNCYVAIWNKKDILEPKIFQSNVSFELVREFYNDIYVALYVVTALDRSH